MLVEKNVFVLTITQLLYKCINKNYIGLKQIIAFITANKISSFFLVHLRK